MTARAYIALGSNLGDRAGNLEQALELLRQAGLTVGGVSTFHETAAVGGPPGQGAYLNAAAELGTELSPRDLLNLLLQVEQRLGRVRGERHGPRTIDLDLLLYDDRILSEAGLEVPHPRLHERSFVLAPLAEIAPELTHPILKKTIRELLTMNQRTPGMPPESWKVMEALGMEPAPAPAPSPPVLSLRGLRAVVTGATSGIGRAIALELAEAGADVLIHGRKQTAAEAVVAEIAACGVRGDLLLADLAEESACRDLAEKAWTTWGPLHIWINNAGADTLTGAAADWPFTQKLDALWRVDVRATMILARDIGQRMKTHGGGVILNMGWDQADSGMAGDSGELFAAVKGAVMAFSRSLALSLAPQVRVNCLAPGWIRTLWGEQASARWQERVRRETPLARWGTAEDVARVARWLVSPAAAFVTGQVIRINGGAVR